MATAKKTAAKPAAKRQNKGDRLITAEGEVIAVGPDGAAVEVTATTTPPEGMRFTESSTEAMAPADPPERLAAAEGAKALFYDSAEADAEVTTIVKVWNPGCVNLDNGKTSVPVFNIGDADMPTGYYCVLFVDEPDERNPDVPECLVVPLADLPIFRSLDRARELPEVGADEPVDVLDLRDCRIQQFKGVDRRTMRIVGARGGFAQQAVPKA